MTSPSLTAEKTVLPSSGFTTFKRRETIRVDWLALWILFSVWCPISGWSLSLLGCLNAGGVGLSLLIFCALLMFLAKPLELMEKSSTRRWRLIRSRRVLPKIWLLLAVLAFIGGVIYTPNNYDYLTYRFPRLLYWCWEQKWYWIPTVNDRMNLSATQFEWMMAPFFILFKTDRLFFLINFISYLFLPGLVFSVFKGLGISRRVSWWWMWVLPCGFCYILQAGSAGNDSFSAVYLLASLHYLFRARVASTTRNLALSFLAIGLMTAGKASNLPLVLPWLILLLLTGYPILRRANPAVLALAGIAAIVASFLPLGLINRHYTGDFFGDPTNQSQLKASGPIGGIVGNFLVFSGANLAPPLWPKPVDLEPMLPSSIKTILAHDFPRFSLIIEEFPIEEQAGAGLGISLGIASFIIAGIRRQFFVRRLFSSQNRAAFYFVGATGITCLVYMTKIASDAAGRIIACYYPLIVGCVLMIVAVDGRLIHRNLFKYIALFAMLCPLPAMILSPSRPLFPVQPTFSILRNYIPAPLADRSQAVYTAYASRASTFQEFIPFIAGQSAIGFLQTGNAAETSLWWPFGSRKVIDITPNDSLADIKSRGLHLLLVSQSALDEHYHADINSLITKWSARLVGEKEIVRTVHQGKETWYILSLDPM